MRERRMRKALALARAGWLSATSYRVATVLQFVGVLATIVPVYFVSQAVQDLAAASIQREGGAYFAFIVVGIASTYIVAAATAAASSAIASNLGSGTFEALLGTRASIVSILFGLSLHGLSMSALRALALLAGAAAFGADIHWLALLSVLPIVALVVVAYAGVGLVAGALVLAFRTAGPLVSITIALSGLLGGAYYSTSVVPGWLHPLTEFVPLTHGLRATRAVLLGGEGLDTTWPDLLRLTSNALLLVTAGVIAFAFALRHARRNGSLSQY
jgi:ABC-2 type transport system permease protein